MKNRKHGFTIRHLIAFLSCVVIVSGLIPMNRNQVQAKKPNLYSAAILKQYTKQTVNIKQSGYCFMHPEEKIRFTVGSSATWSSSNTKIAKVTQNGTVYIPKNAKKGNCLITAKAGGRTYQKRVVVTQLKLTNHAALRTYSDFVEKPYIPQAEFGRGKYHRYEEPVTYVKASSSNTKVLKAYVWGKDSGNPQLYAEPRKPGKAIVTLRIQTYLGTVYDVKEQYLVIDEEKEESKAANAWLKKNQVHWTEEKVLKKIKQFQKKYPQGYEWTPKSSYGGCLGGLAFLIKLSNYIYGKPAYASWIDEKWGCDIIREDRTFINYFEGFTIGDVAYDDAFPNKITYFANDYDRIRPGDIIFIGAKDTYEHNKCLAMYMAEDKYYDKDWDAEFIRLISGCTAYEGGYGVDYYDSYSRDDLERNNFLVASRY